VNQKFSITMFAAGLPTFLGVAGEMLAGHNEWKYFYETPLGFMHAIALGAAFVMLVVGAIGIQLPRADDGTHAQRKSDIVVTPDSPDGTTTIITTTKETMPVKEQK